MTKSFKHLAIATILVMTAPAGTIASGAAADQPLGGPDKAASGVTDTGAGELASGAPVTMVGAGDIAGCDSNGDEATAALLDGIPGTVFTLGDNAYESGTAEEFDECYDPTWGRHKGRTRPTPGNHEYESSGAAGYYDYFGARAGPARRGYYSYDLGTWHVIALNSNCSEVSCSSGSAQVQWLREDLAASNARCTVAYWHHPRFNSGSNPGSPEVAPFWDALYEADADLILSGHEHIYERFAPQRPDAVADSQRGIRQFTVGTGGHGHSSIGSVKPNSQVRHTGTFGVLRLDLRPTGYDWRFVPEAGETFTDTGSGDCHGSGGGGTTVYVDDDFERNVSTSWGKAPTGGPYSESGPASAYEVEDGRGAIVVSNADQIRSALLEQPGARNVNFIYTVNTNRVPIGASQSIYAVVRRGQGDEYRIKLRFAPSGEVYLVALRVINGAESAVGNRVRVPGLDHDARTFYRMRARVTDAAPTVLRARAWRASSAEPAAWHLTVTDSHPALQDAGSLGLRVDAAAGATNTPYVFRFEDLRVTRPTT